MKKYTVFTSFVLVLLMVISVLGACKKSGEDDTQATGSGTKTATAANTTAKASASVSVSAVKSTVGAASVTVTASGGDTVVIAEEEGTKTEETQSDWAQDVNIGKIGEIAGSDIDLGGITIYAGTWHIPYIPKDSPEMGADFVIWARRIKAAEKKYNFKLEWYVNTNATKYQDDMVTQALSGVVCADVFRTASSYRFPMFVKNNVIVSLDDYIDYESPIIKANKYMYNGSYWKGKHYGIMFMYQYACEFMWYNSEILSKEGQPDILDLVEAKQWNWGTMLDIAKNCTKDSDGDGKIDQYGLVSASNWYLAKYLLYSNGLTCGTSIDNNYNVNLIIRDTRAIKVWQFISDLAFVHKVYLASSPTTGLYPKGLAAMQVYNWGGPNTALINNGMKSYLTPMPMGPDVDYYTNINASQFYAVSSASKHPAEVAKIFLETSLIWDENGQPIQEMKELMAKYYPADWLWNSANPARLFSTEREYKTTYLDRFDLFQPDYSDGFPNLTARIQTLIVNPLLAGTMSVAQALDSAEGELQGIVNEFK